MANELKGQVLVDALCKGEAFLDNDLKPHWNTRPTAPVEGLETVLWANRNAMKLAEKNFLWEVLVSNRENYPHYDHALVARSQAEAIIAAKDAKIAGAEEAHKTLIDVKNSIIEGLAKNLFVFAQDTGSRMTDLEANNAALTARVKELEEERVQQSGEWVRFCEAIGIEIDTHEAIADAINTARSNDNYDRQALEAQLAAANKELERFREERPYVVGVNDGFALANGATLEAKP